MAMNDLSFPYRDVAIIMLSAIGDTVHVLPVVNAVKRAAPEVKITWVIQPTPHRLVYNHPAVHDFIVFRRHRGIGVVREFLTTAKKLRRRRFDLVIALQVYLKTGFLTAAAPAPVKLGFDRARARDLNWLFTSERIPAHAPQHVQDQYFEFLDHLGIHEHPAEWGLVITEEEREAQQQFFERLDRPACAVVVGTSKPEKNWPVDRYAQLLEVIEGDFGYRVVLVGGPSPAEQGAAAEVVRRTKASPLNELGDDLRRLLFLLDGSAVVISPDTGPVHIARALDVPVIGLYGYTNPKRTGPYGRYRDLVVDGYARYPGEDYPVSMGQRADGMSRITVDMVLQKFGLAAEKYVGQPKLWQPVDPPTS